MTKENYTHIAIVMDRSGSMGSLVQDMEGGLKTFIDEQKQLDGEATVTYARFDSEYELVHDFVDIQDVGELRLQPRGMTALLDAMGKTMSSVKEKVSELEEKPSRVIFIFITDGLENSSREYNRERVFEMITELSNTNDDGENQEDDNGVMWDFRFLGANQDAISAGGDFGIRRGASLTYDASDIGTQAMYTSLSRSVSDYRSKGFVADTFSEEDREAQESKKEDDEDTVDTTNSIYANPK